MLINTDLMDYEAYFGLQDRPFREAPDPDYYHPGAIHELALQALRSAIAEKPGLILLTGPPGAGKTLLLKILLRDAENLPRTVALWNAGLKAGDVRQVITGALGLARDDPTPDDAPQPEGPLLDHLEQQAREGGPALILLDRAHTLPDEILMEILAWFDSQGEKGVAVSVVLTGAPELEERIRAIYGNHPADKAVHRLRLKPLTDQETRNYIRGRIRISGGRFDDLFSSSALGLIHMASRGLPRRINHICERALMAAAINDSTTVDETDVERALASLGDEPEPETPPARPKFSRTAIPFLLAGIFIGMGILFLIQSLAFREPSPTKVMSPPPADAIQQAAVEAAGQAFVTEKTQAPRSEPVAVEEPDNQEPGPMVPVPPPETLHLPAGAYLLAVDTDLATAYLWQGDEKAPVLRAEFKYDSAPATGMYILGRTGPTRHVLFNFPTSKSWPEAGRLWSEVSALVPVNALPLITYSADREAPSERIAEADVVRGRIRSWAEAWRQKDVDRFILFYGQTITTFKADGRKEKVYSRNHYYDVQKKVFQRAGDIEVKISDPVCILDPGRPDFAAAVFRQTYSSRILKDDGIQTLFLRRVAKAGSPADWRIVGRLWIPLLK